MFRTLINIIKKKLLFILIFSFLYTNSFADTLSVPYSRPTKEIIKIFKRNGIILDKTDGLRGKKSVGFIINRGTSFDIVTYRKLTEEGFNIINKIIVTEVMNGKI